MAGRVVLTNMPTNAQAPARALNELTAIQAARAIATGEVSAEELMRACLSRIAGRDSVVRAWASLDAERSLAEALLCDRGPRRGPLHGVPIGVKDVLNTADLPTEMGSPIYSGFRPRADAACVAMLRAAGAIVVGKTVTCEFAGVEPGPTVNPRDATRTPGGSSSGSAAAVADFMVPVALGTQTGGSVLRPASFCGVVGYKPSYGTVSREGLKFAAESLDTIGVIARTPEDAGMIVDVLAGREPAPVRRLTRPPRLAVCMTYLWESKASQETRDCVARVADLARAAGASVVDLDLPPHFSRLSGTRDVINDVERARSLAWEWSYRREDVSERMRATIARGRAISSDIYYDELRFARNARVEFDALVGGFDGVIAPCVNGEAPAGLDYAGDPSFQSLWTLLHTPAITLPAHRGPNDMPVGVQIIGRRRTGRQLIALATWLQAAGVREGTDRR